MIIKLTPEQSERVRTALENGGAIPYLVLAIPESTKEPVYIESYPDLAMPMHLKAITQSFGSVVQSTLTHVEIFGRLP